MATAGNDQFIRLFIHCRNPIYGKQIFDSGAHLCPHLQPQSFVFDQFDQSFGQSVTITRLNEKSFSPAAYLYRSATQPRGNHRNARTHSFKNSIGIPFRIGWQNEDIRFGKFCRNIRTK